MAKVLLVDPHPVVRVGLQTVLASAEGVEVVGSCADADGALQACAEKRPDLVITEVSLPGSGGVELCRAVRRDYPQTEVLVLTADDRDETVFEAIRAGASGYVLKDISPENLVRAVQAVLRGETMVHLRLNRRVVERLSRMMQGSQPSGSDDVLSEREVQILVEVAKGATNKEIARKLFVAESTVKTRLRNIFRKISVRDRAEAAAYAVRKGYVR